MCERAHARERRSAAPSSPAALFGASAIGARAAPPAERAAGFSLPRRAASPPGGQSRRRRARAPHAPAGRTASAHTHTRTRAPTRTLTPKFTLTRIRTRARWVCYTLQTQCSTRPFAVVGRGLQWRNRDRGS
eukprot:582886-Pleurochrysis_carterae.AAC.1